MQNEKCCGGVNDHVTAKCTEPAHCINCLDTSSVEHSIDCRTKNVFTNVNSLSDLIAKQTAIKLARINTESMDVIAR